MYRPNLVGLLLFCAMSQASGQLLSFGVKAGVPLTDAYSTFNGEFTGTDYKRLYLVGPTVEVHLPFHLSIEADALYRRNGFTIKGPISPPTSFGVNDWQFPILLKVETHSGPLRPFVDGGLVYRHISGNLFTPDNANTAGVAFGAGLTIKVFSIRISPEVRYTYLPTKPFSELSFNGISSKNNQADVLLGITF